MCYFHRPSELTRRQFIHEGLTVSAAVMGALPITIDRQKTTTSVSPDMSNIDIAKAAGSWIDTAGVVTESGLTWLADPMDPASTGNTL